MSSDISISLNKFTKRSLRNTLDWQTEEGEKSSCGPDFVVPRTSNARNIYGVELPGLVVHLTTRVRNTPATEVRVKRFLDLIAIGNRPCRAAERTGVTNLKKFMSSKEFRDEVKDLIETDNLPAGVRRAMVQAGLNRIFMDNYKKEPKIALEASKQIGADPEVGLNQPQLVGVPIDMGAIGQILAQFEKVPALRQLEGSNAGSDGDGSIISGDAEGPESGGSAEESAASDLDGNPGTGSDSTDGGVLSEPASGPAEAATPGQTSSS